MVAVVVGGCLRGCALYQVSDGALGVVHHAVDAEHGRPGVRELAAPALVHLDLTLEDQQVPGDTPRGGDEEGVHAISSVSGKAR